MCLVRGAVFPVAEICCSGFPGSFQESRPWVLSLGAVLLWSGLSQDGVHEQWLLWLCGIMSVHVGCVNMSIQELSRCVCHSG